MHDVVLRLTWTRHRIGSDIPTITTHIANDRVAQPIAMGGLAVPDTNVQSRAMKLSWARKLRESDRSLTWVQLLETNLREATRPNISTHFKLGVQEWKLTATKLGNIT